MSISVLVAHVVVSLLSLGRACAVLTPRPAIFFFVASRPPRPRSHTMLAPRNRPRRRPRRGSPTFTRTRPHPPPREPPYRLSSRWRTHSTIIAVRRRSLSRHGVVHILPIICEKNNNAACCSCCCAGVGRKIMIKAEAKREGSEKIKNCIHT